MSPRRSTNFADTRTAKAGAVLILAASLSGLAYLNRDLLLPTDGGRESSLNPEFVACLDERSGHVDQLLADVTISAEQAESFRHRGEALCAAQYPPDGSGGIPAQPRP